MNILYFLNLFLEKKILNSINLTIIDINFLKI